MEYGVELIREKRKVKDAIYRQVLIRLDEVEV